ncbi:fungal-specific transcription factor domain-containing protein [Mycena crocata]|nr:fungal-specific transcription factor domain-containing protein [Mycena crocata]
MPAQQQEPRKGKRQRLPGSCDICRKKKVSIGDSATMPNNRCTNCVVFKLECTHNRDKARGTESAGPVQTGKEYVAAILSASIIYIPPDDPHTSHRILLEVALYARSLEDKLASMDPLPPPPVSTSTLAIEQTLSPQIPEASHTSDSHLATPEAFSLAEVYTGMISSSSKKPRCFDGQSSSVSFAKAALKQFQGNLVGVRRRQFWTPQPWKTLNIAPAQYSFPQQDLLTCLVEIYFAQINPLLGILHCPSFRQSLADGLHLRDPQFGAVVLAVCSLASRYSDNPRVLLDGANSEHSCGWKWFQQVRPLGTVISSEPSLHQIQLICLSTLYLCGLAPSEEVWLLTGLGIRFAQAAGAHHRSGYKRMQPLEAELYKRVFWTIVATDTIDSSFKGRPRMSTIAELDLDLPIDADPEYWDMPNPVQPMGKPSSSAFMIAFLRLMEVVTDLDSELNKWVDLIPAHLRWEVDQENQVFLDQSAALYTCYYHAQIMIHRPFIPGPGMEVTSNMSFPSLAICTNAARSCGHVMDVQTSRGRGPLFLPNVMDALFDSAVILLIKAWSINGGRNSQKDFDRATADVHNCIRLLRLYERRWSVAGSSVDILNAMLNIGKFSPSLKRPRDNLAEDAPAPSASQPPLESSQPRPIVSSLSSAMSVAQQIGDLEVSIPEEFGRLSIYNPFYSEFPAPSDNLQCQPQSHWKHQADSFMEPEFVNGFDSTIGSLFRAEGITSDGEHLQIPSSSPFEIPAVDGWRDWTAYLASVEGLNFDTTS